MNVQSKDLLPLHTSIKTRRSPETVQVISYGQCSVPDHPDKEGMYIVKLQLTYAYYSDCTVVNQGVWGGGGGGGGGGAL